MGVVVLMLVVWVGVFTILRMALASRASTVGATAFVGLVAGLVAANDHGLWWGEALSLAASAVMLGIVAMTVRPRFG